MDKYVYFEVFIFIYISNSAFYVLSWETEEEQLEALFDDFETFGDPINPHQSILNEHEEEEEHIDEEGIDAIGPLKFARIVWNKSNDDEQPKPTSKSFTESPSTEEKMANESIMSRISRRKKRQRTIFSVAIYEMKQPYDEKCKMKFWKQKVTTNYEIEEPEEEVTRFSRYLQTFCLERNNFVVANLALNSNIPNIDICMIETCHGQTYVIEPEIKKRIIERNFMNNLVYNLCYDIMTRNANLKTGYEKTFYANSKNADLKRRCCRHHFKFYFKYFPVFQTYGKRFLEAVEQTFLLSFTLDVGFFLSFVALMCIFLSTIISKRWRHEKGNMVLFHFSLTIFAQMMIHFSICLFDLDIFLSKLASITFQYFTLVEFSWTSIIAYMQYKRYVKILNAEPISSISTLVAIAYLSSAIPTFLRLILEKNNNRITITYLTFSMPQFVVLIINFVILLLISRNIVCMRIEFAQRKPSFSTEIKLIFILFFIFDLGWVLALLAFYTSNITFAYIFILVQSIQGFILFFIFVILNKRNRIIYKRKLALCSVQNVITIT